MRSIWVLGDQLDRRLGALGGAAPGDAAVLLVERERQLLSPQRHRQRLSSRSSPAATSETRRIYRQKLDMDGHIL